MNRSERQAWLANLVAEDVRKRALAEPELRRKEAALLEAQAKLAAINEAIAETEAQLETARRDVGDANQADEA